VAKEMADLTKLIGMSNKHGKNPELVLAGGGNTSCKERGVLYVKCSGTSLEAITADGFVAMDMAKLTALMEKEYPEEDTAREAEFLKDVMDARCDKDLSKRPSVEALLHSLFPQKYVLHIHPALVNGLTCSRGGEQLAKKILGEKIIWIPICRPGYVLGKLCNKAMAEYRKVNGQETQIILLQNHGIFLAADTTEEIDQLLENIICKLEAYVQKEGHEKLEPRMSELTGRKAEFLTIREASYFVSSKKRVQALLKPFTPDHIVYCGAYPLFVSEGENLEEALNAFKEAYGDYPKIVLLENIGAFALYQSEKEIQNEKLLLADAMKVAYYAERFGGVLPMTDELTNFITHWEAESYRKKQA